MRVAVAGLREAIARVKAMQANLANPGPALMKAGIAVRDRAVWRIKQQGGDQQWQPTIRGGHIGVDTGRMWQSIGISQSGPTSVTIGTNVPYAVYFQFGTGIYAGHGRIYPRAGKVLSFVIGGKRYFARSVAGQPPRPFLLITAWERERVAAIFARFAAALPPVEGWT